MIFFPGLLSLVTLILVHLLSISRRINQIFFRKKFIAFASGISLSYVFIDLLPAINKGEAIFKSHFNPSVPYLDRHCYIIALAGLLFYAWIKSKKKGRSSNWLEASGYLFFNFIIGAALTDINNPELQPLSLFTIAIGLHYFVRDHLSALCKNKKLMLSLAGMLIVGYLFSSFFKIPDIVLAFGISFASGGILLNVLGFELPDNGLKYFMPFLWGALVYTVLLLSIGEVKFLKI